MNSVEFYKSILEKEVNNSKCFLLFFSLFFVLALFLFLFLYKRAQNIKELPKLKSERKLLNHKKKIRNARIELVVFISLLSIIYSTGMFVCGMNIKYCLYDIKYENYIIYDGDFEVTTELSLGKGSHRTHYKIVFENQGQEVCLYFDVGQYQLTEGSYHNMAVVYSGRSQVLLEIQKESE